MGPRRSDLSSISKSARRTRKRRKKKREEAAQRKERSRLYTLQSHATKSSQHHEEQKEAQFDIGHLSQDVTSIASVPVIKTEILDPSEQNQEFILPDYLPHVTSIDPVWVVKTEIQDSSKTNKLLLPNIKVEQTEIDSPLDESSRTEDLSESFINSERDKSLTFKYKLTKCSVLLHDCLIPENLISILAKCKSLRINRAILKSFPKLNLFLLSDAPFLPHISEAYKKMAFPGACEKMASSKNSKPNQEVRPNNIKKKRSYSKKHICTCFKATEDEMLSMGSQFDENYSESTQQLCSCLTSDFMLSEPTETLMKKTSLFDPHFGKITCGINKIDYNF